MKLEFFRQFFGKYSNIRSNENLYSVDQVTPFGRTDGQTDMTQLLVAFRHFANALTQQDI
jgi:hypothetical protein